MTPDFIYIILFFLFNFNINPGFIRGVDIILLLLIFISIGFPREEQSEENSRNIIKNFNYISRTGSNIIKKKRGNKIRRFNFKIIKYQNFIRLEKFINRIKLKIDRRENYI